MTSNCTACAREKKTAEPSTDLKVLFSATPKKLRHSPLDPTCPTWVAEKLAKVSKTPTDQTNNPKSKKATSTGKQPRQASDTIVLDREGDGKPATAAGEDDIMTEAVP